MKEFWNERYSAPEFAYGEAPNEFFRIQLDQLPVGKILLPAEGEGRNAVYAARQGWAVWAYDFAEAGRRKALELAERHGVQIHYDLTTHEAADYPEDHFDAVALIYAHTPARRLLHEKAVRWLRPGGTLLLEGFSKDQLRYRSGGPRSEELLFDQPLLEADFRDLSDLRIEETVVELQEGRYHRGQGAVIRVVGRKPE